MSATFPAAGATVEPSLAVVCGRFWWPVYGGWRDAGDSPGTAAAKTRRVLERLSRGSPFLRHDDYDGRLRLLMLAEQDAVAAQPASGSPPPSPVPGEFDLDAAEARDSYGARGSAAHRFRERWAIVVMEQALEAVQSRAAQAGVESQVLRLLPYLERDLPDWRQTDIGDAMDSAEVNNLRDAFRVEVRRVVGTTVTTPMALEAELAELFG